MTRPADLHDAHAVYVGNDPTVAPSRAYRRLFVATVDGRDRRPLLPDGLASEVVMASRDGSVIVFDAWSRREGDEDTWWWADATGTHAVPGLPDSTHALSLTPDGRSVVVATGSRTAPAWSVQRVDLRTGVAASVCQDCVPLVAAQYPVVDLAIDADGTALGTMSSFLGGYYGVQTRAEVRLADPRTGAVLWSTTGLAYAPIAVDDATFVWSGEQGRQGRMLHEVTVTGSAAHDRVTGIEAVFAGPLADGWWYATTPSSGMQPGLTLHQASALAPSASHVVAVWPGTLEVRSLALAEVTSVDWPGPTPSGS